MQLDYKTLLWKLNTASQHEQRFQTLQTWWLDSKGALALQVWILGALPLGNTHVWVHITPHPNPWAIQLHVYHAQLSKTWESTPLKNCCQQKCREYNCAARPQMHYCINSNEKWYQNMQWVITSPIQARNTWQEGRELFLLSFLSKLSMLLLP